MPQLRWIAAIVLLVGALGCPRTPQTPRSAHHTGKARIFGVSLWWETPSAEAQTWLEGEVLRLSREFSMSMDPDCIWRSRDGGCVQAHAEQTATLESLADEIGVETLGYFDIRSVGPDGQIRRDFAGISQGYFLETLARQAKAPWLGNFAGDIYVSGGFKPELPIAITDPLAPRLPYAKIELKAGWAIASTGRGLGAKIRNPNASHEWTDDYQRVVLFAQRDFNGARLDAWSTALMAGGEKLMAHLWQLEKYRGQWGYFLFDENGKPSCSANVECVLDGPTKIVRTPF